jgi:hypothetical protein
MKMRSGIVFILFVAVLLQSFLSVADADIIIYPPFPPSAATGSISINSGAAKTNSRTVSLLLDAHSNEPGLICVLVFGIMCGITSVELSNDGMNWSGSYPGSSYVPGYWTLSDGYGTKTVYVKYNVANGYSSGYSIYFDSIDYQPSSGTTPDPFIFTTQSNVPLNTGVTSNTITVSGLSAPTSVSVSGGQYSVNGGPFTSMAGTVSNGDTVAVRQTSSASYARTTNIILIVGVTSTSFSVTTAPANAQATSVGYSPQWLVITLFSLMLAGGYLVYRKTAKT